MSSTGNCINHMHLNFIKNHFGCSERCSDSGTKQAQGFKLGCHGWRWIICFLFFFRLWFSVCPFPYAELRHCVQTLSAALEFSLRVVVWVWKKLLTAQCSANGALGLSKWMSQIGGSVWPQPAHYCSVEVMTGPCCTLKAYFGDY